MSASFKAWLLGVVCAAMLAAMAECFISDGGIKRVFRLAGGMVLILAMIRPIVKVDSNVLEKIADDYEMSALEYREGLQKTQEDIYESIIAERVAAYISDKAKEIGFLCNADLTVAWDGEMPCLQAVRVKGTWTEEQRQLLADSIERDLGIPIAMQYFEETES